MKPLKFISFLIYLLYIIEKYFNDLSGKAASSHNHSWSNITSGKPTTLSGYGITDAYTKTQIASWIDVAGSCYYQGVSIHNAAVWKNEQLRLIALNVNVNQSLNNQQAFITIATLDKNPTVLFGVAVHTTNSISTNITNNGATLYVSNSSAAAISQPRIIALLKY